MKALYSNDTLLNIMTLKDNQRINVNSCLYVVIDGKYINVFKNQMLVLKIGSGENDPRQLLSFIDSIE